MKESREKNNRGKGKKSGGKERRQYIMKGGEEQKTWKNKEKIGRGEEKTEEEKERRNRNAL